MKIIYDFNYLHCLFVLIFSGISKQTKLFSFSRY